MMTAYASAAATAVPVPFTDLALLLPFHTAMVMTVGHVLGRTLNDAEAKQVALELGAVAGLTLAGKVAIGVLKKFLLPGLGGFLAAPASFAVTWAFGRLTMAYFKNPEQSREDLNTVFKDAMREGAKHFSKEAFDRFRRTEDAPGTSTPGSDSDREGPSADGKAASEETPTSSEASKSSPEASKPSPEASKSSPRTEPARAQKTPVPPSSDDPSLKPKKRSL